MKKYAYKTTKITKHNDNTFSNLCIVMGFDNLYAGQIIEDINGLLDKIQAFKKYSNCHGLYLVDATYQGCGDNGLHFFRWDTFTNALKRAIEGQKIQPDKYNVKICYEHNLFFDFEKKK